MLEEKIAKVMGASALSHRQTTQWGNSIESTRRNTQTKSKWANKEKKIKLLNNVNWES